MILLFYIAGAVAVIATVAVILQTNIVHALIYLILSLLAVAVCFYVLGAPFAAILEAIVYAGAIMVLFLFVIMMLNMGQQSLDQERSWMGPKVWVVPSLLASVLLAQLLTMLSQYDQELALTTVDGTRIGNRSYQAHSSLCLKPTLIPNLNMVLVMTF